MTPMLRASGLAIPGRLHRVGVNVEAGQMVALIGPNGSGKTSLLRAIAGIDPSSGSVAIDGEALWQAPPGRRLRLLGFLPASRDLAWPISVRDVIALGLPKAEPDRIDELLACLELEEFAHRPINRLSTGERARALLARALASRPRLLLLDEPLSNLDPYWVIRTLDILRDEVGYGAAAIVSLHDLGQIERFDRVLLLRGGALVADSTPDAMLAGSELPEAFRISRSDGNWRVSRPADRRSSP
ncbi:MAG TPA: ABC transporter ATP-binding protein [Sphingomicrobium sp.]|nr:ABC transporter ATP-binding protein [Sphingomicrobium sp.]